VGQGFIGAVVVVLVVVWLATIWLMFVDPEQLKPKYFDSRHREGSMQ
jgi:hypothetical protein